MFVYLPFISLTANFYKRTLDIIFIKKNTVYIFGPNLHFVVLFFSSLLTMTQTPWKIQPVIFTWNKKLKYFLIRKAFLHSIVYYGDWKLKFEYFSHCLIKYSIFRPFISSKCVNNIVKRDFLIHFFNSVCAQLNYLKNSVLLVYIAFIVFL